MNTRMLSIFALISVFSASVLASDKMIAIEEQNQALVMNDTPANASYFDLINTYFDKGSLPDVTKLIGKLWAGRCFLKIKPDIALNGAYTLRETNSNGDVGPIGNDRPKTYEGASIESRGNPANHFDNITLQQALAQTGLRFYTATPVRDAIQMTINDNLISRVRVSEKYVIEQLSDKAGVPYMNCYYFIPGYSK